MFHLYGPQGRVFTGSLEELRTLSPVGATARARRLAPLSAATEQGQPGAHAQALAAYGGRSPGATGAPVREPLRHVADVMSRPAFALAASTSVAEAWRVLALQRLGQAPVTAEDGRLVGLAGRAELMPPQALAASTADAAAWQALLARPVATVMWSPVPAAQPDTELRRAAALLLDTGLPGVPVTDDDGRLLGFVSRSDLLRAIVADPPLDLWG